MGKRSGRADERCVECRRVCYALESRGLVGSGQERGSSNRGRRRVVVVVESGQSAQLRGDSKGVGGRIDCLHCAGGRRAGGSRVRLRTEKTEAGGEATDKSRSSSRALGLALASIASLLLVLVGAHRNFPDTCKSSSHSVTVCTLALTPPSTHPQPRSP